MSVKRKYFSGKVQWEHINSVQMPNSCEQEAEKQFSDLPKKTKDDYWIICFCFSLSNHTLCKLLHARVYNATFHWNNSPTFKWECSFYHKPWLSTTYRIIKKSSKYCGSVGSIGLHMNQGQLPQSKEQTDLRRYQSTNRIALNFIKVHR